MTLNQGVFSLFGGSKNKKKRKEFFIPFRFIMAFSATGNCRLAWSPYFTIFEVRRRPSFRVATLMMIPFDEAEAIRPSTL